MDAYRQPPAGYLEQRSLRRHARILHLWAMGVGAVISGDFFGWNFGLQYGFPAMLGALAIATVLYAGLCFSIAEMAAALPHTGGAYSFARTAMGPWGGFITGLAENMEYVLTPAVIVVGIGGYLGAIFGAPASLAPLWWLLCYALFVGLNCWGVELSFRFSVVVTIAALVVLGVFYALAFTRLDLPRWSVGGTGSPLDALPFAIWFYLAIEQLPLAAEESHDPTRTLPRGLVAGFATLVVLAFATLLASAGVAPGAAVIAKSTEPLLDSFQGILGKGLNTSLLGAVACIGLVSSFHTIIFAYGRQIYSLSRAGYLPTGLSLTHPRRRTPVRAMVAGAALGFLAALAVHLSPQDSPVGAVLLNMTVFGAVLAYVLQMGSYLTLRWRFPHLHRPYRSPLGIAGAVVSMAISLVVLAKLVQNGVLGPIIWMGLGIAYFAFYARKRLILAPEEEFAQHALTQNTPGPR